MPKQWNQLSDADLDEYEAGWLTDVYDSVERDTVLSLYASRRALQAELAAERGRCARLRVLFHEYSFHRLNCPYAEHLGECNCGYGEAEAEVGYEDDGIHNS